MRPEAAQLEAHRRADREVRRRLTELVDILHARNYGQADDYLRDLMQDCRHDHGAQEFHPMFERHLETLNGGARV
jgi:hypothetical protein